MSVNPQPKTEIGICPGCGARIRFQTKVQVGEFVICDENLVKELLFAMVFLFSLLRSFLIGFILGEG